MTDEARKAMRDYKKAWRQRNPEKVRATNERYWEKRAAKSLEAKKGGAGENE
ncbi:MAG: hypothetical protein VB112_06065 [Oscillospiraceae bacterium]|nr:hypothetical protein [Oscillospiraceae bacterium]